MIDCSGASQTASSKRTLDAQTFREDKDGGAPNGIDKIMI